jgi:hypothetical protein
MPNHVNLILVPSDADGLRRALSGVHRRYAGIIHARRRRTGHFWQGRFGSVVMDEDHLAAALRYVSLNPVRARISPARTMESPRVLLFTSASRASRTCSLWNQTRICPHACAPPKALAGRSETIGFWPVSSV